MTPSRSGLRRTSSLLLACWALVAPAQNQRPVPPDSPEPIVGRSVRVHVVASEDLEPDIVRALAGPAVTLWVTTRSNTLRESTVDTLARFEAAWVQLRAPLSDVDARAMRRAPKAGWWVPLDATLREPLGRLRGSRPLAVEVEGGFDERQLELARGLRPTELRWRPSAAPDLLEWSLFRGAPGRQLVVLPAGFLLPRDCEARPAREPAAELHVATLLALSAGAFPCGRGTRVEVAPDVEPWLLKSLIVRDPSVELVVRVDDDPRKVGRVRALLGLLAGVPVPPR